MNEFIIIVRLKLQPIAQLQLTEGWKLRLGGAAELGEPNGADWQAKCQLVGATGSPPGQQPLFW